MLSLPSPRHMPCEHCGASVERGGEAGHQCEDERRLEYRVFALRDEIESFDENWTAWLQSPEGLFELFYAERTRRG
ncbi:MAG TPA: hypothetical protein VGH82_12210 [Gaiellaceae bacterium]|jgi:hypothetical protein